MFILWVTIIFAIAPTTTINSFFQTAYAQKESTKLVITIEPTYNGKLTIELPRTLIDY